MSLLQLLYVSRAVFPHDPTGLQSILDTSRRNNARDGLTGCLLFSGHYFAQVLEGEGAAVVERLSSISSDVRHADVRVLSQREIKVRHYEGWAMGSVIDLDLDDELEALVVRPAAPVALLTAVLDRMKLCEPPA